MSKASYTTRAAFLLPGKKAWTWITWTHSCPDKLKAVVYKMEQLRAVGCNFRDVEHGPAKKA